MSPNVHHPRERFNSGTTASCGAGLNPADDEATCDFLVRGFGSILEALI